MLCEMRCLSMQSERTNVRFQRTIGRMKEFFYTLRNEKIMYILVIKRNKMQPLTAFATSATQLRTRWKKILFYVLAITTSVSCRTLFYIIICHSRSWRNYYTIHLGYCSMLLVIASCGTVRYGVVVVHFSSLTLNLNQKDLFMLYFFVKIKTKKYINDDLLDHLSIRTSRSTWNV